MRRLFVCFLCAVCVFVWAQEDWHKALQDYLRAETREEAGKYLDTLQKVGAAELLTAVQKGLTYKKEESGWVELKAEGMPATLYVPPKYDAAKPAPILFFLHGAVNRPQFVPLKGLKKYIAYFWKEKADKDGWFLCAPASKRGLMWWQAEGTRALEELLRRIKRRYNIDERRVWVGGFSDGGSGAFHLAAHAPTHFAALIPLNGNPMVPDRYGAPVFVENFKNRPVYAIHTERDPLYPAAAMKPIMDAAKKVGANLVHRIPAGTHRPNYLPNELPKIADFLAKNTLKPPSSITWFVTDTKNYGRCDWLVVRQLKKGIGEKPDCVNPTTKPRKVLGVRIDTKFAGHGVRVIGVAKGTAAAAAGILPGDVITKLAGKNVKNLSDLREAIKDLAPEKPFSVTVQRGGNTLTRSTKLPKRKPKPVFTRPELWGAVTASFSENDGRLKIKAYNVSKLTILLTHPLFEPGKNLQIEVNGKVVYSGTPQIDVGTLLKFARTDMNRNAVVWGRVDVEIEESK